MSSSLETETQIRCGCHDSLVKNCRYRYIFQLQLTV